jgi:hypothetical protein
MENPVARLAPLCETHGMNLKNTEMKGLLGDKAASALGCDGIDPLAL